MDGKEIKETKIWVMYDKCVAFARKKGLYSIVDRCNNFYNGDQWEGLLIEGIEPVVYNFVKPIVNYKTGKITESIRAINYGADNIDNTEFRSVAKKVCDLLNQRAARVWEKDKMDHIIKRFVKKSAICGESVIYVSYDEETKNPKNELLNMVDVYYGNENEPEIQSQPYILIKQRKSVAEVKEIAKLYGVKDKDLDYIIGDDDNIEEAGQDAKDELENMCTIVTKFYRSNGTIWYAKATKYLDIKEDVDMETTLYPLIHMLWCEKEGSARGEGEVRVLIPNQIETNKTAMRRLLTAKNIAYPQKVYDVDKIQNPDAINTVGGTIEVSGMGVDDVSKAYTTTKPTQMSPDVEKIQNELISTSRELANASDKATGQVNPEDASGIAILAVQQASQQPLTEQNTSLNIACEELARIWFDMWQTYNEGMQLENIKTDPTTGEDTIEVVEVEPSVLEELRVSVKIDITPKGAYDKYAQEISLENLAKSEYFMNTAWLEDYMSILDNDAVMPKIKIEELVKRRKEAQKQIREIQQRAMLMQENIGKLMETGGIAPKELNQYYPGNNGQIPTKDNIDQQSEEQQGQPV